MRIVNYYTPKGEDNDCTVRAMSAIYGITYRTAHKLLSSLGRDVGDGFDICLIFDKYLYKESFFGKRIIRVPRRRDKLKRFGKNFFQKGTYLVCSREHVFAVINNVMYDCKENFESNMDSKILIIYKILDSKED